MLNLENDNSCVGSYQYLDIHKRLTTSIKPGNQETGTEIFLQTAVAPCLLSYRSHKRALQTNLISSLSSFGTFASSSLFSHNERRLFFFNVHRTSETKLNLEFYVKVRWHADMRTLNTPPSPRNRASCRHFQNLFSKFVTFTKHRLLCRPGLTCCRWTDTLEASQRGEIINTSRLMQIYWVVF